METEPRRNLNDERRAWWLAENREARLAELWPDRRVSATEIGQLLGCTKNKVISKAHRQGLGTRDPDYQAPASQRPRADIFANPSGCMWPIGHPTDDDFHFCGGPQFGGKPYCAHHAALAYLRPEPSKKRL